MRGKDNVGGWCVAMVMLMVGCSQRTPSLAPGDGAASVQGTASSQIESQRQQESSREQSGSAGSSLQTPATPRRFSRGEVLFIRNCAGCHGWEGKGGGPVGQVLLRKPPSLHRPELLTQNTESELIARILLGKDLSVPLSSEPLEDTERDVAALITYLRHLPSVPWKEVSAGQEVYDSLCVSCHGIWGRGDGLMAAALTPRLRDLGDPAYQSQVKDAALFRIISEGKGAMPSTTEVISEEDRRAVIAFIRLLSPGHELYNRFCEVCHGATGTPPEDAQQELFDGGGRARKRSPVFNAKYMKTHTDKQLRGWVRHMLKQNRALMPHFGGELDAEEVRQILAYLRSLPPQP